VAGLNDDAQWIILMGFVVSTIIFILALIVSQSALVGQTTSESVLEFSKGDIQDLRSEIIFLKELKQRGLLNDDTLLIYDLQNISMGRMTAVVEVDNWTDEDSRTDFIYIHFNDGITSYNETYEEYY
jgi:hypothetical protein